MTTPGYTPVEPLQQLRARGTGPHRMTGRPWRSALRWPAALALVVAGATHLPVTPEHLKEAPYIGVAFIVLMAACGVLAVAITAWDTTVVWWLSGVTCALAVAAYGLSRTFALPQIGDDVGNWLEPLGVAAVSAELLTVVLTALALHHHRSRAVLPTP